jgi:branched-chain amino acid transport system ATP-binding protein
MIGPACALEVVGLTKRFGGLTAVDNVSLRLASGRLNAIIGPNGAGKTTLFNLVTGELRPDDGSIRVHDLDITGLPPHKIVSAGVSRTLQIKSVFGNLTVADNVRAAVMANEKIRSFYRPLHSYTAVNRRVSDLIAEVGLYEYRERKASTLSYGDVALLELALALANRPKLLLLDEPVCGMGPEETERAVDIIRRVARNTDVVIIEHDMEVVFSIADHIVVMAQGAVLAEGSPQDISSNPHVQEAYLGAPEDED